MMTMAAAVIRNHGGPDHLRVEEFERPVPGDGEVVIRVAACALNRLDIFVREGMPGLPVPLPHIGGGDIAGWVDELGPGTAGVEAGALVLVDPITRTGMIGETLHGGLAEFVKVPAANLVRITGAEAAILEYACLPVAYGTASRMLFERGELRAGEVLVVVGASGGVGVACVQLGVAAGARVIACTSSEAKAQNIRELGAEGCVVAPDGRFGKDVWRATGRRGADVVVDYSGQATWGESLRCVRRAGRLLCCGATTGFDAVTDLRYLWTREIDIRGSDGWSRAGLLDLCGAVARGELVPVIHGIYPLSEVTTALAELEDRVATGKVIVVPDRQFDVVQRSRRAVRNPDRLAATKP